MRLAMPPYPRTSVKLPKKFCVPWTRDAKVMVRKALSESVKENLDIPKDIALTLAADVVEVAAPILEFSKALSDEDLLEIIQNKRLTPTLLLRALCMGDTGFFEAALARQEGISVVNAYMLIHNPGKQGFSALFRKCSLPENLFPVFRAAVEVSEETEYDGGEDDQNRYRQRMIERILTQFEDGFDSEDLDFFIDRLGRKEAIAS